MRLDLPNAADLASVYAENKPFPHVDLGSVFGRGVCIRAAHEFPPPTSTQWHTFSGPLEEGKQEGRAEIAGPSVRTIHERLASAEFVDWLSALTGIDDLIADPYKIGGGIHQVREHGRLGLHVDYSLHPQNEMLERRVNVILFVANAMWPGADLVLYNPRTNYSKAITPRIDRLVVFEAGGDNYHGHPEPLQPPHPLMCRKSIPAYFFAPAREGVVATSTRFLENVT